MLVLLHALLLLSAFPLALARDLPPSHHGPALHTGGGRYDYAGQQHGDMVCRPFGECEACPADEIHQPFCHPYGNRRLVHCIPRRNPDGSTAGDNPYEGENEQDAREVPAWESCGKVISTQKADYWEFVVSPRVKVGERWLICGGQTTNTVFLIISLVVLVLRAQNLATIQYRQLAARIGIVRSS